MVIFHCYVSSPEGNGYEWNLPTHIPIGSMVLLYMVTLCNIYHEYTPNGSYGIWDYMGDIG